MCVWGGADERAGSGCCGQIVFPSRAWTHEGWLHAAGLRTWGSVARRPGVAASIEHQDSEHSTALAGSTYVEVVLQRSVSVTKFEPTYKAPFES